MKTRSKKPWNVTALLGIGLIFAACQVTDSTQVSRGALRPTVLCGDGALDAEEECDDGNRLAGDGCGVDCDRETACGNGTVDPSEDCEPPGTATCSASCGRVVADCGNGELEAGEDCEDGNAVSGDGCSARCRTEVCGNRVVDEGEGCEPPGQGRCDAQCQVVDDPRCGDGEVAGAEECDDNNRVDGDGCSRLCQREGCGNGRVEGLETCDPPLASSCSSACQVIRPRTVSCGDGIKEILEECDDGNSESGDGCNAVCLVEACGNGRLEGASDQECEPPGTPFCDDRCLRRVPSCGDGVRGPAEECEDGNTRSGDGCSGTCLLESCGNGRLDQGEECEPPGQARCDAGCRLLVQECGDGRVDPPEVCDDRNTFGDDGCSADCRVLEFCGNGFLEAGEECELPDGTTCDDECKLLRRVRACGNAVIESGEECDDGNAQDGDGCNRFCIQERCGNGTVDYAGECEPPGTATCDSRCNRIPAVCGDGIVHISEECDDRNRVDGDGCSSACQLEVCGNGRVDSGEMCEPPGAAGCGTDCRLPGALGAELGRPLPAPFGLSSDRFDVDSGWSGSSPELLVSSRDGAVELAFTTVRPGQSQVRSLALGRCLPSAAGTSYAAHAAALFQGDVAPSAFTRLRAVAYETPDCTGPPLQVDSGVPNQSASAVLALFFQTPARAQSIRLNLDLAKAAGDPAVRLLATHVALTLRSATGRCGDGVQQPGERCEPSLEPFCTSDCRSVMDCARVDAGGSCVARGCGDGLLGPNEACEPGMSPDSESQRCSPWCTWVDCASVGAEGPDAYLCRALKPRCGDGFVDKGEACEPPGIGRCSTTCALDVRCGDGLVQGDEQCDPPGALCGSDCRVRSELDCEQCLVTRECGAGPSGLADACLGAKGTASGGPSRGAARRELCAGALACLARTGCAEEGSGAACYCGKSVVRRAGGGSAWEDVPERLAACREGRSEPNGPCRAELEAASESTVPAQVLTRLNSGASAAASAARLMRRCGLARSGASASACAAACAVTARCGNGVVEVGEQCDGSPGCDPLSCQWVGFCGDGAVGANEQCDPEDWLTASICDPATCSVRAVCGDGVIDQGEQCEPGIAVTGGRCCTPGSTACRPCHWEYSCGDGRVELGEDCEPGVGGACSADQCSADCRCACSLCSQEQCGPELALCDGDQSEACRPLQQCLARSKCATSNSLSCYCGSNQGPDCLSRGPAPDAECVPEILRAAGCEAGDHNCVVSHLYNSDYASGRVFALVECQRSGLGVASVADCHTECGLQP